MAPVVKFEQVSIRRGEKVILDAVDWTVSDGDRWVILGENGAGKTTMLQIAAGRLHPTSGIVNLLGRQLGRVDVFELRPRIGLASSALALRIPGDESVQDVVITAAYAVVGRWNEEYEKVDVERARELLARFRVEHLADRRYGTLSEGERKRVQIARALMTDPELLLLDEPAAGLDLSGREELVSVLAELALDPLAPVLVLVTHHLEEIPPGFNRALLIRDGRVEAEGPLDQALTPQHLSRAFGIDLIVERHRERWSARSA